MHTNSRAPIQATPKKPLPKARKVNRMGFVPVVISAAVCLALVLVPCIYLGMEIGDKRELKQTGLQTSATVNKHHSKTVRGGKSSTVYHLIDYTFAPNNRAPEHSSGVELPADLWDTVQVGSTISVTYNPASPSDNQPTMTLKRLSPFFTDVLGLFAGVIVEVVFIWIVFLLFRLLRSRRRDSKGTNPGAGMSEVGRPKKRRSKHAAPKARMAGKVRGVLEVSAVLLGIVAILAVFIGVLICGLVFVGPLVVDLLQNVLL